MTVAPQQPQRVHPFDALATIGCIYLALITAGFAAFRYLEVLPAGAKRNQDVTFFTSANAVSLTGFEHVNAAVGNYPTLGLIVLGTLAVASALTTFIGGGYLLARALGVSISMPKLTLAALTILALPMLSSMWIGGFNAVSASVGLGLWSRPVPSVSGQAIAIGLSSLALLGVLPVRELLRRKRVERDSSRVLSTVVAATALLFLIGVASLLLVEDRWCLAGAHSLSLRAFGGATAPRLDASPVTPWLAMIFSLLGSGPASTAGGLSVLPMVFAVRGAIASLTGKPVDRQLGVAIAWIGSFILAIALFTIALAQLAPALPGERVLMLVSSALSNTGISYEPVGITGASLFALSAAMLFGRLLPLVMLAWMASVADREIKTATPALRSP